MKRSSRGNRGVVDEARAAQEGGHEESPTAVAGAVREQDVEGAEAARVSARLEDVLHRQGQERRA